MHLVSFFLLSSAICPFPVCWTNYVITTFVLAALGDVVQACLLILLAC